MLNLTHFPGEVLAHLFRLPCASHTVVSLWKCGDSALNAKLARYVDTVILEDQKRYSTSRWPKMLSALQNLRVLSISRNGILAPPHILSNEASRLSKTLIELEIHCFKALGSIMIHYEDDDLETSQPGEDERVSGEICWNVGETYPNLRKLVLQTVQSESWYPTFIRIASGFWQVLPPTIEHLDVFAMISSAADSPPSLPPSLTHLTAVGGHLLSVPPQMEHLRVFCAGSEVSDHPNLKTACITIGDINTYSLRTTAIEQLRIRHKMLMVLPPSDWLPCNLKKLEMPITATADFLKLLPRCLEGLSVSEVDWSNLVAHVEAAEDWQKAIKSLFPQLRVLSCNVYSFPLPSPAAIAYLPSTLHVCEKLELARTNDDDPKNALQSLPWTYNMPLLRDMTLSCGNLSFPNGIPATLTSLSVTMWVESAVELNCLASSNIRSLELNLVSRNPQVQQSLSKLLSILPKKLEKFELELLGISLNWTSDWSALPPTLLELHITRNEDEHTEKPARWKLSGDKILPFLPSTITNLTVTLSNLGVRDLLAMPCRNNLNRFKMNYAPDCGSFSPEWDPRFVTAWPPNAASDSAENWEFLDQNSRFYQRCHALDDRDEVYPDPRTINPNAKLKYGDFQDEDTGKMDLGDLDEHYDFDDDDDDDEEGEFELEYVSPGVYRTIDGELIRLQVEEDEEE